MEPTKSLIGGSLVFMVVMFAIVIISLVAMAKIYAKAGRPGWAVIIPVYGQVVLFDITHGKGWLVITMFIPVVNLVMYFIVCARLAKVFGKGTGFGVGLMLLPIIFIPMLAFGDAEYIGFD